MDPTEPNQVNGGYMELLLLSNSRSPGQPMLAHAADALVKFVAGRRVTFLPYALADHSEYAEAVAGALGRYEIEMTGLHTSTDPIADVRSAEVLFVGGGNTFRLLRALQSLRLVEPIRDAVLAGAGYLGASAGTNMACPTLRTTNDMPIVEPGSFQTLDLIPFQINPHYLDPDPASTHMGETREERLLQFLEENDVPVLGLREGSWLLVTGDGKASLGGPHSARLFERGREPLELPAGAELSSLLASEPRFDTPSR
ncbi:MAG: dipeptidase [Pseudonocardiales bacterium]|nr:dipeptidase [Pseudonocardiales bacterium]